MCEYSQKLIPWIDCELADDETPEIQRHIEDCVECRSQLANYERVSGTFDAYCDAVMAVNSRRKHPSWLPALSAAAAAISATLMLFILHTRLAPPALPPAVAADAPPALILEKTPVASKPLHHRPTSAPVHVQSANWLPAEPAIQIAIPAESMFPPGAVPEGVNFTADVSFGPDGSAEQLGLRPRLIGFERSITQP